MNYKTIFLLFSVLLLPYSTCWTKTYYISKNGSNGDGLSKAKAWTSLSKVNEMVFQPGDCYNNIFQTTGGLPLLTIPGTFASQNPVFLGNLYWSSGHDFSINYGKKYSSLATFRGAGPHCEHTVAHHTGIQADPKCPIHHKQ